MTHDSNLIVDKIDGKVSTSLRRFCSDGAEMFRHVKRLRANLRNLTVVSQSSRSPERKRSREDSFWPLELSSGLNYYPRYWESKGKRKQYHFCNRSAVIDRIEIVDRDFCENLNKRDKRAEEISEKAVIK